MTENEKSLRDWMLTHAGHAALKHLDALLAAHRSEVAAVKNEYEAARDAALEEAAHLFQGAHSPPCYERPTPTETTVGSCGNCARAGAIRALKSRPASVVPMAKVREVLTTWLVGGESCNRAFTIRGVAKGLGIDLDAPPERVATSQEKTDDHKTCPYCCERHSRWTRCHRRTS